MEDWMKNANEFFESYVDSFTGLTSGQQENFKIKKHPDFVLCDLNYDNYHFRNHWYKNRLFHIKIIRKLKSLWK